MLQSTLDRTNEGITIRALAAPLAVWRFCYYAPDVRMPVHGHDFAQVSTLLAGAARETTHRRPMDLSPAIMVTKPVGFGHANEFGPDGALLLSINLAPSHLDEGEYPPMAEWRVRPSRPVRSEWALLAKAMAAGGTADLRELENITVDLLAALTDANDRRRAGAPAWLARAREAVRETELEFQAIAVDAGVHRVHLARAFRRYFDVSMTECRRGARLGNAIRRLIHDGANPVAAGHDAGFADQSHFTRTLRREMGLTPARLRRLFAP